jgi:hypothetical protein
MRLGHDYHTTIEWRRLALTWIYPLFRKSNFQLAVLLL